jgi:cytochrome c-type biogenesis protein CcmH/NrfF
MRFTTLTTQRIVLSIVALVVVAMLATGTAFAQGGDEYPEGVDPDEVYRIARTMYCDVCQGVPLADCPSQQCQAWREEIADMLLAGYKEDEIRETFGERYGEKISGVPLDESNRLFTYAIPIALAIVVAAGVGLQIFFMGKRRETQAHQAAQTAGLSPDFERPVPDNVDPVYLQRLLELLEREN